MIGVVILASEPPSPRSNGEQLELLSPTFLLDSAIKPFIELPLEQVILVLGHDYHRILNTLKNVPPHLKIIIHRKPERGVGSALSVGLQALDVELSAIVIALGDQVLNRKVPEKLIKVFQDQETKLEGKKRIVIPLYHGKRGFPWVVSAELRKDLLHFDGDLTLDTFLKSRRKDVLAVSVDEVE